MKREEVLDRFCYLKIKKEEIEEELAKLQGTMLGWKNRVEKEKVPPYGTLTLIKRSNWKILDIPGVFKKLGRETFLGICSVPAGKLQKVVGDIGFDKLQELGIVKQDEDTEYYTLKKNGVFKNK
ncbi:MAG: hypothetical protein EHM49_00305 [Deltaproteobacteria bacterium]|nr:MAG: hypothetical protein EHM49_00305 [Deltaproteobacteria bacterium]